MLFGYPTTATQENWFHDCLCEILQTIHTSKQQGKAPPVWPAIIPTAYQTTLRSRHGLRNRLNNYETAVEKLNDRELDQVINALNEQNAIISLLSGTCNCETIDTLPESIRQPVKELFAFAFELLKDLGVRDRQYEVIYNSTPYPICPFCGCEYFDAPGAPREALDHYLSEKDYPFAAANLHNLVPMGNKCNSKYKHAENILYNATGARRKSYYPYTSNHHGIRISLENSEPFAGLYRLFPLPLWRIDFEPNIEETTTWDTVFHIQERYKRDILDPEFMSWLREFSSWCSYHGLPNSDQELLNRIEQYTKHLENMKLRDRAFLKGAVFRMLHSHCQQGNQRLLDFIKRVVVGGMS